MEGARSRSRVRVHRRAQASRGSGEAHSGRRSLRHPVGAFARRRGGDRRARLERSARRSDIVSCASCTTNCITPIVEIIGRRIGFKKAMMTTIHAYTSSQSIVDGPSKNFRRGRAAAANLVPATTGAALATTRALPEYGGLFDGIAIRAPANCRLDRGPHLCHLADDQRRRGEPDPY